MLTVFIATGSSTVGITRNSDPRHRGTARSRGRGPKTKSPLLAHYRENSSPVTFSFVCLTVLDGRSVRFRISITSDHLSRSLAASIRRRICCGVDPLQGEWHNGIRIGVRMERKSGWANYVISQVIFLLFRPLTPVCHYYYYPGSRVDGCKVAIR